MLKKIMKAALAASLVFGMSSFAYAADLSVGGKFAEYFGQYNSGVEDTSAYFQNNGESQVKITGKIGKMSVYHELEANTVDEDAIPTQTKLTYDAGAAQISIGNVTNIGTIPKSSSGFYTSNIAGSTADYLGITGYSEGHGVDVLIPIQGVGMLDFTLYPAGGNALTGSISSALEDMNKLQVAAGQITQAQADAANAEFDAVGTGTAYNLGLDMTFGQLGVKVAYATAKSDDPEDDNDKAMNTSNMGVAVSFMLNKGMMFTAEYALGTVKGEDWDDPMTANAMDVGAMVAAGPGTLWARVQLTETKSADPIVKTTDFHVSYDYPVAKGAGISAGYASNTTAYDSDIKDAYEAYSAKMKGFTESYLCAGFYAVF